MPHARQIILSPAPQVSQQVCVGLLAAEPVAIGPAGPDLLAEIAELCKSLAQEHAGKSPSQIPGLAPARKLYKTFGVDPTKTRPSSESLLRRVVKGKAFPQISNAVDLCNYFALRFLLSLGLYDADKIQGQVTLRRGKAEESFAGIRKAEVHLQGRLLLADAEGPFGNPSSDSLRTCVDEQTRSLWMVIFAPADFPAEQMQQNVQICQSLMTKHLAPTGESIQVQGSVSPLR